MVDKMSKLVIGGIANPEDIEEFYRALKKRKRNLISILLHI